MSLLSHNQPKTDEQLHREHEALLTFWKWIKSLPAVGAPDDEKLWKDVGESANFYWEASNRDSLLLDWMHAHMKHMEDEARAKSNQETAGT